MSKGVMIAKETEKAMEKARKRSREMGYHAQVMAQFGAICKAIILYCMVHLVLALGFFK